MTRHPFSLDPAPLKRTIRVYTFPSLKQRIIFYPRLLQPISLFEKISMVAAYMIRRHRFRLSDLFASLWTHAPQRVFVLGHEWTTRQCDAEYFLRNVDLKTEHVIFLEIKIRWK
jgi:hypothetical protein